MQGRIPLRGRRFRKGKICGEGEDEGKGEGGGGGGEVELDAAGLDSCNQKHVESRCFETRFGYRQRSEMEVRGTNRTRRKDTRSVR